MKRKTIHLTILIILALVFLSVGVTTQVTIDNNTNPIIEETIYEDELQVEDWMTEPFVTKDENDSTTKNV